MNRAVRYAIKIAYDTYAYMGTLEGMSDQDIIDAIEENNSDC